MPTADFPIAGSRDGWIVPDAAISGIFCLSPRASYCLTKAIASAAKNMAQTESAVVFAACVRNGVKSDVPIGTMIFWQPCNLPSHKFFKRRRLLETRDEIASHENDTLKALPFAGVFAGRRPKLSVGEASAEDVRACLLVSEIVGTRRPRDDEWYLPLVIWRPMA